VTDIATARAESRSGGTQVRRWRRISAPLAIAAARLRSRPGRTVLVVVGVAAATAALVGVFGGSLIAQNRALQEEVGKLPETQRNFRVDLLGQSVRQAYAQSDRPALEALAEITTGKPLRVAYLRDAWLDGEFVRIAGIDDLAAHVRLLSGRLPRRCEPSACEVLQIGTQGRRVLREGGLNLVRVGIGELSNARAFGTTFQGLRQYRAQQSLVRSTILLLPNATSLAHLPAVQVLFVVRSWIATLLPSRIRTWQVSSILARESRAQTSLERADPFFALVGPDAALLDASTRDNVYRQRAILLGAGAAVLLLVFAMLTATGLRRGIATERWRLFRRGATVPQVWLATVAEVGTVVLAGWLVGLGLGAVGAGLLAGSVGLPENAVARHALLTPNAMLALLGVLVVALVLVVATMLVRERERRRGRLRPLDIAALGAALAATIGLTRGSVSADTLAAGGGDKTLLLLLPALVFFAGAVAAARLLGPVMALSERASRRGPIGLRIALLALARAPVRTAFAVAFLVVSVGLALFAATYRATLERGASDEAGFAVPLDETLSEGSRLVLPLDAASLRGYDRLGPHVRAYVVLRRSADVPGAGTSAQAITVLGVPSTALQQMYWRSDFSTQSHSHLAATVARDPPATLRGPLIPKRLAALRMRVHVRGSPIVLDLALQDGRGRIDTVRLGEARSGEPTLTARVPRRLRHSRLIGLELSLPLALRDWYFHLANEGRAVRAPTGAVILQPLRGVTAWRGWLGRNGGRASAFGDGVRVTYSFAQSQTVLLRPREPTDGEPLRVIASPAVARVAAPGGRLTLDFEDERLSAQVVATARRFPTIQPDEPFVVTEETRLATALDADAPGTGEPDELWLRVPPGAARAVRGAFQLPPFSALVQTSRTGLQEQRDHDPLARGVTYTLVGTTLVALALAVIGIAVTLLSDLRDESGHFFDLEAQGVSPATLRTQIRVRAFALVAFGVVGGVLIGLLLSRLVVSLVQVSVETTTPDPPLVENVGWTAVGVAVLALVAGVGLAAELAARKALAGETPKPPSWSLE
jgi:hypothetical protein